MNLLPKHIRSFASVFLFALLISPMSSTANDDTDKLRSIIDGTIRPLMSRHGIPGMAVGLTLNGRPFVFNYGVSSLQSQAPVTESTIFEVGSISKMFTTTLAAYAQATGKLSLDEHPSRYIPQLRGRSIDKATLLHLGTYTAGGLPLQFPHDIKDNEATIAYFQAWKADAPPGTVRVYSNPSIGLLGMVTATALKNNFATLVETQLLPKFGMRHSYLHVPAPALADYAWGYRDGKPVHVNPGPLDEETYGIKSTASDMIRFVQANIDPSELEAPLRRAVNATQLGYFKVGGMMQGFGWEQYPYPLTCDLLLKGNAEEVIFDPIPVKQVAQQVVTTLRLFDKTGSTGGFGAYVAFVPAKRIGLVMLANTNYPIPARVEAAYAILDQLVSGH